MALFIGRQQEAAQLRGALEVGAVCLVGPRGVGLSRLAAAVAPARLIERGEPAPPEPGPGCLVVGRRLPGIPAVEVGPLRPEGAGRLLREAANLHNLGAGDALSDEAVSALVALLDGLPGAILAAAAQLPILGVGPLLRVAADGLWFDRSRDAEALSALDNEARGLLEGLAMFSGPFRALDAVAAGLGTPQRVLPGLLSLQRAGLLVAEDGEDGERVLRLLRRTRAVLPEQAPSAVFAAWLSEQAVCWIAAMDGPEPRRARLALRRHRADLEAVVARGGGGRAALLGALSVLFDCDGPAAQVRPLLEAAIAAFDDETPQAVRYGLLLRHEVTCRLSGDAAVAVASAERAQAEAADEAQRAQAGLHLARARRLLGQPEQARQILAAQRARWSSPGLRLQAGWARMQAVTAYDRGDLVRCRALTLEGLELSHRARWPAERARLSFNLYILRDELGHGAENAELRDGVLRDLEDTGQRWLADTIRVLTPHDQRRAGALSAAEASLGRARALAGADPIHGLLVVLEEGWLALARGRPDAAAGSAALAELLVARLPAPQYAGPLARLQAAVGAGPHARVQIQRDGMGFTIPGAGAVDLSRRGPAARIVAHLLEHTDTIGVPSATLVAVGWPGQVLVGGSGAARLHTVVRWLRKAGLAEVLLTQGGGYRLDLDRVQIV